MANQSADFSKIIRHLPESPGVYEYFDKDGTIIYVGKAKNLKKRVSSYFTRDASLTGKVRVMVQKIADIQYVVVDTELDALLLENNLIKKHQPRYNVLLKDDKTYPWICLRNEPFPRVFHTRNRLNDGSEYFGPYASGRMMHTLLDLVRQLFKIRTCSLNLSPQAIKTKNYKVCLEYHIQNCLGPCVGKQTEADYLDTIASIRQIIKGNIHAVRNNLVEAMKKYAAEFEFEKAQVVKEKIELLDRYQSKSLVVSPNLHDIDVFSYLDDASSAYVNYLKIISGAIIQSGTVELKKRLDESREDLLMMALAEMRVRYGSASAEIIVPFDPGIELPGAKFTIPQRGEKLKLLELSERNAKFFRMEKYKQLERVDPENHTRRILAQMKADLRLTEEPARIECFDNSNFQGAYPVAAMVVFTQAKPDKKEYRHFNIRTVEGPNDFASMEEIIYRRYKRVLEEHLPMPQLIIVDGGKGQLSSAMDSLEKLGLRGKVAVIGIAKRLEEIYYPGDSVPLYIDKKSETLRIIQQLRDEAHRFGITHHRKRRDQGTLRTGLTDIAGIGENTAKELLRKFRSLKAVEAATREQLSAVIGIARASKVYAHFHPEKSLGNSPLE